MANQVPGRERQGQLAHAACGREPTWKPPERTSSPRTGGSPRRPDSDQAGVSVAVSVFGRADQRAAVGQVHQPGAGHREAHRQATTGPVPTVTTRPTPAVPSPRRRRWWQVARAEQTPTAPTTQGRSPPANLAGSRRRWRVATGIGPGVNSTRRLRAHPRPRPAGPPSSRSPGTPKPGRLLHQQHLRGTVRGTNWGQPRTRETSLIGRTYPEDPEEGADL